MHKTELWITKLFNDYLAGVGNAFRHVVRIAPEPRPWEDFIVMQVLVVIVMMILFAVLKPRLSVDRPGKLQHTFEVLYGFLHDQAEEQVGHGGHRYLAFFGTIFFFILFCNLIGVVPGFESPTKIPSVPAGCAMAAFFYYNIMGIQANGLWTYLKHFAGPMPALAILMIPIELVSHLARPLSLTIRLFANMYAGEQVTLVFIKLTLLFIPVAFMGLHIFVSFLQAYIFMLLTMMYVAGAVAHDH